MVHIKDIRVGNLLIHKKIGIALVIKVEKNVLDHTQSIIHGIDYDDKVYTGPCEDWFYIWSKVATPK